MPDLSFQLDGVAPVVHAASPTLAFRLRITNAVEGEAIHSILLRCQFQIEAVRRRYTPEEQGRLFDLFGPAADWSRSLKTLFWTQTVASVPGFTGDTVVDLPVPCSYDFSLATTKYFDALTDGDLPLCLLPSGTVFYGSAAAALQVAHIPWAEEIHYRLPAGVWHELRDRYFPNMAWLGLRRDTFDELCGYKRAMGFATWEQALQHLIDSSKEELTR